MAQPTNSVVPTGGVFSPKALAPDWSRVNPVHGFRRLLSWRTLFDALRTDDLGGAFEEWVAGGVYVCKKTGRYRYRRGDNRLKPTPWDETVRGRFSSVAEFDQAARHRGTPDLGEEKKSARPKNAEVRIIPAKAHRNRIDAIALARKAGRGKRRGGRK